MKFSESFEEIERHARRICLGNEAQTSNSEPTEEDAQKLESLVAQVKEKLSNQSDARKAERNVERLKLFNSTFDMLNDLYLITRTIKTTQYEGKNYNFDLSQFQGDFS